MIQDKEKDNANAPSYRIHKIKGKEVEEKNGSVVVCVWQYDK